MTKYTKEQAEKLKEKLKALPPIEEKIELSKQDLIKTLQKDIKELQKKGYSLEKITEVLKAEGVEISVQTLKNYLQRGRKTKGSKKKSNVAS